MGYNFNEFEDAAARQAASAAGSYRRPQSGSRPLERGRTAVWQARLVLLVMINLAQLWILSAAVEAALARHFDKLVPLIVASAVCWVIALTIVLWWKPVSRRYTSAGYIRPDSKR